MTLSTAALIFCGGLAGGFISGLAGFGLALITLSVWLHVIDPIPAVMAALTCSVAAQLMTIRTVWHIIEPRRVLPFIVPGLLGVPIGLVLLGSVPVDTFKRIMGCVLILFGISMLTVRRPVDIAWGGRWADGIIGFLGGVMGGFAGISGPMPTVWAILRGWGKDEKRSVFQAYNVAMLSTSALAGIIAGRLDTIALQTIAIALPAALAGARLGLWSYTRLSDRLFTDLVLALITASGVVLLAVR
jgi:uncharacterized membrane protein YfcA